MQNNECRMMDPASRRFPHHPSRITHQTGVALVVTLLLLSIITFMAVTFLVVSRSQRGSVVTDTDQEIARLAADTAFERAKADIITAMLATTNEFNYGLLASTNYINAAGFDQSQVIGTVDPLNVNYDRTRLGATLNQQQRQQNIANLFYFPRPPVYITNWLFANSNDFRYYLDLNRNGRYDTNGLLPVISGDPANPFYNVNGTTMPTPVAGSTLSNFFVGDPEWIGTLERSEFPHSADNKFINRYAYFAVPVGNTLDLNYLHNQAGRPAKRTLDQLGRDFVRDQGVGTWEINAAAFLYDLNTNTFAWGGLYNDGYNPATFSFSLPQGNAFVDAGALIGYRYNKGVGLASVAALYSNGPSIFRNDGVDGYTSTTLLNAPGYATDPDAAPVNLTGLPWSGADNPNHYNSAQDLWDESKTSPFNLKPTLTERLRIAGATNDSYSRYTFYRLLSQLGTDSAPEPTSKLNLNYCNVDKAGNIVPNMATNFIPWLPEQFFTNAAIRLLANAGYTAGVGPTNLLFVDNRGATNLQIQIWPTNFYTPSVHRLLQLAANIYDASTNRTFRVPTATNGFPSVFRPLFALRNNAGNVFITDYKEVEDTSVLNFPQRDLTLAADRNRLGAANQMAWGIPLVIGAKKGLPNFNKFAMQTQVQVTRKLQFHRENNSSNGRINEIDQMFVVGITNSFSVEAWNSYATTFPRNLQMRVFPVLSAGVTNLDTGKLLNPSSWIYVVPEVRRDIPANTWTGYDPNHETNSFVLPFASGPGTLYTNLAFLSNATYRANSDTFVPLTGEFERTPGRTNLYVPNWRLGLRTRLRFALVDTTVSPERIVDYVNLDSSQDTVDSNGLKPSEALTIGETCGDFWTPNGSRGSMWCTNRSGNTTDPSVPTFGILNQLAASAGQIDGNWTESKNEFPAGMSKEDAIAFFKGQFQPSYLKQSNTFAAPFQPFRNVYKITEWEANDPLVHYTINDLRDYNTGFTNNVMPDNPERPLSAVLAQINRRYQPWGGNPKQQPSSTAFDLTLKDPVARNYGRSDEWDFPTNRFPNVGWLGRVHRGSPWQTVYLKAFGTDFNGWKNWSGNGQLMTNFGQIIPTLVAIATNPPIYQPEATVWDAAFSQPTNDWRLLDLFTSALDDNATRGQLSINQTNLAAWSAVLSGVVVLSNTPMTSVGGAPLQDSYGRLVATPLTVQPAGVYNAADPTTWPPLVRIVHGLNSMRTNFPHRAFQTLGDVLAVPELTIASPFLSTNVPFGTPNYVPVLNDAVCERIPQQILGLLKCDHTPRFLVYSFGQTLKPAAKVSGGQFFGLVTNYQIMAEVATRAVVRIDGAPDHPHAVVEGFSVLPPD
jgi:hypothetical protein